MDCGSLRVSCTRRCPRYHAPRAVCQVRVSPRRFSAPRFTSLPLINRISMRIQDACFTALVALGLIAPGPAAAQRAAPGRLIDSLVARMTLEEKLGQLNLPSVDNQPSPAQLEQVRKGLIGGFLHPAGAPAARAAQRPAGSGARPPPPLPLGLGGVSGSPPLFSPPLRDAAASGAPGGGSN